MTENVEERVPGKQGLKPFLTSLRNSSTATVEERVPGKQGLKPKDLCMVGLSQTVEERVPGKQGLKQARKKIYSSTGSGRRASSRKTRIETRGKEALVTAVIRSKSEFQENKD